MKQKVLLFWSGGKESALALYYLKQNPEVDVVGLMTTMNADKNAVPYHGIPDSLITEQAKLLKLPVQRIFLPENCSNDIYLERVGKMLELYAKKGITHIAFGDIHLKDVRAFREQMLAPFSLNALFPLWNKKSHEIADEFLSTGHRALVTAVHTEKLDASFLACEYNQDYIARLPLGVDVAGENGEFHTFVTFGPGFKMRVPFSKAIAINEGPYLVSTLKEP